MSVLSCLVLSCILGADLPLPPELPSEQEGGEHILTPSEPAAQSGSAFSLTPRALAFSAPEIEPEGPAGKEESRGPVPSPQQSAPAKAPSEAQKAPNPRENQPRSSEQPQDPREVKPPSPRYDSRTPPPPRYHSDQQGLHRARRRRPSNPVRRSRAQDDRRRSRGRNEFRTSRSSRSYDSRGRHYDSRRESEAVNRRYQSQRGAYRNRSGRGRARQQDPSGAQRAAYRNQSAPRSQRQLRVRQGGPNPQGRGTREDRPHMVELGYGPYGGWWGGEISYLYHLQGGSEGLAVGAIVSGASIGGTSSFSLGGKFQWDFNVMEEEKLDFFAAPFAGVSYQWASTLRSDVGVTVRAVIEDRWVVFIQPAVLSLYAYVGSGDVPERFLPVYHGAAGVGVLF